MPALMLGRMKLGIRVVESKAEMFKPAVLYSGYQSIPRLAKGIR
jgi:hypothetical protein